MGLLFDLKGESDPVAVIGEGVASNLSDSSLHSSIEEIESFWFSEIHFAFTDYDSMETPVFEVNGGNYTFLPKA